MILPDTSVWVDHLRRKDQALQAQLDDRSVLMHPFVIGEVALGQVAHRAEVLLRLHWLPRAMVADTSEVLRFIDRHKLIGTGIGYVDAHLLVSCRLTADTLLWTRDKRLLAVAARLSLAAEL
ncbi:type II toxin-antitoxin system VapC family toxin [Bradyrhizobium sp.]